MYIKNVISHKCHSALKLADVEQTGCNTSISSFFWVWHVIEILNLASPLCHVMLLTVSIGCRVPSMFVTMVDIWPSLEQCDHSKTCAWLTVAPPNVICITDSLVTIFLILQSWVPTSYILRHVTQVYRQWLPSDAVSWATIMPETCTKIVSTF